MYRLKLFFLLMIVCNSFNIFAQQDEFAARVRIYENDYNRILSAGITPIHGIIRHKAFFEGEISSDDLQRLKMSNLHYEILSENIEKDFLQKKQTTAATQKNIIYNCGTPKTYQTPSHFTTGSMGGYFTYSEAIAQLDNMRALFPNLITPKTQIGLSIENRPIYAVIISDNPGTHEGEKQILYTSLHHSQEPAGLQQLIFFMYYLLENYATDAEIKYLVDNLELHFVPVINPDGYVYNQTQNPSGGGMWRKNRRQNDFFSNGVDLNRNYGYQWGYDNIGSHPIGSSPWYRGTAPFSEPESQTMKNYIEANNFLLDLNWHSYGNLLIYPWNFKSANTTDSVLYEQISRYLTIENHYRYGRCDQTYGYNSNGDADDWGYGDTSNKNKVISLTAEIGPMSDGFWPNISNIETLSKQALDMNIRFAKLATKFALLNDISPTYITSFNAVLPIEVYCLGLDNPANFTVSVTPISPSIISTSSPLQFNGMTALQKAYNNVNISLHPSTPQGSEIVFSLNISNGTFIWRDTIVKVFCQPDTLFYDAANDLSQWNANGWSVTSQTSASAPACFTESPAGNYGFFANASLEMLNPINLAGAQSAYLLFKAKWDIEKFYDWLQVFASSDNGSTWQPLCGRYSTYGSDDQREGEPVYDGYFHNWVNEEIDLSQYAGSSIKLKFVFRSDQTNHFDGFYLDDIMVLACSQYANVQDFPNQQNEINIFPNPANNYFIVEPTNKQFALCTIKMMDLTGRKLLETNHFNQTSAIAISTDGIEAGTYILQIETCNHRIVERKIVIIR